METTPETASAPSDVVLAELKAVVGARGWLATAEDLQPFSVDWLGDIRGKAALLLLPETTEQVSKIVKICARYGVGIVPQGGNTSLMGGSVPFAAGDEIIVNMSRMNRVRAVDALNDTITVEAGCILAAVQVEALKAGRQFALRLGAEGSCQIGGNIATNAGGSNVIRYGNIREQVLGIEAVLPDGRIWDGLRALRKDNTGYDLKQLFIGSEGTLGIVTAAVLKLTQRPASIEVALCAVSSTSAALQLLTACRQRLGDALTAFELLPRFGIELALKHFPCRCPLKDLNDWQILLECSAGTETSITRDLLEQTLAEAFDSGTVTDAVFAESEEQRRTIWHLRELLAEADTAEGAAIHCDISLPISAIPEFLEDVSSALSAACAGCRTMPFGHMGDGNIHYCVIVPLGDNRDKFLARSDELAGIVHRVVHAHRGSISAEHGLGRLKRDAIIEFHGATETDLKRTIKKALDPNNIMNRGKLVDRHSSER